MSTQHFPTLLAQHLQAPAKRSQNLNATDRSIIARNMLHAFGHSFARCCNMLRVQNRASAHAQAQRCCTNLAKRQQHHATFTNVTRKIWPFSNLSQRHPTPRNMSHRVAKHTQHVAPSNVAICCFEMLRSFGRGFINTPGRVNPPTRVNFLIVFRPFECNHALSCPGLNVIENWWWWWQWR